MFAARKNQGLPVQLHGMCKTGKCACSFFGSLQRKAELIEGHFLALLGFDQIAHSCSTVLRNCDSSDRQTAHSTIYRPRLVDERARRTLNTTAVCSTRCARVATGPARIHVDIASSSSCYPTAAACLVECLGRYVDIGRDFKAVVKVRRRLGVRGIVAIGYSRGYVKIRQ